MAREIPSGKRLEVAKLYFDGLGYDDIGRRTGVAKGTVAAIVGELRDGKFPQFEQVAGLVSELRELAVGLRKAEMAPAEAVFLFLVAKKLVGSGVDPAHLGAWVEMCQSIPEGEFPRSQVIQAATRLVELEQKGGLSYEEAVQRLSSTSAELKGLEETGNALMKELSGLEEQKASLSKEVRALEQEKLRLQRERKESEEGIQKLLNRSQTLAKQAEERSTALSGLEEKHQEVSKMLPQLQARKVALEEEVADRTATLRTLDELGFSKGQLEKLRATLREMMEREGMEGLPARFFQHLGSYDSLLKLEAERQGLAAQVQELVKQRESLGKLGERLGLSADEVAEGIAAMKSLQRKGVSPASVASYQRLLSAAGIEHESFERMIEELGGVAAVLSGGRKEREQIEQELAAKGQALQGLKAEEGRLKESIATLRDSAVKQIQEMAGSAVAEVQKLRLGLQEDIIKWGETRAAMGRCEEELRLARYFTSIPLTGGALSSLVEEITAALVIQHLSVDLAWCRQKLNPKLRPPRAIIKKYYTISEYTEVELADLITWALLLLTEGMGRADR